MGKDLPHKKAPCKDCPFKKSALKGWLGRERMEEITNSDSFVCHKNTSLQCAGHMLLLGDQSAYVRLAKVLNIDLELKGEALVFDSINDCIEHHA